MIKVVNYKRKLVGLAGPAESIMRGRSVLANPFIIGKDGNRNKVIAKYRRWLWVKIQANDQVIIGELERLWSLYVEHGRLELVCCCKPLPCHGDVIVACLQWMKCHP